MAQRLTPSVLATAGGQHQTNTISLEWTLGEAVVETTRLPNYVYTQGFHQPTLQVTEQVNPLLTDSDYLIQVFPNPVEAILTVRIEVQEGSLVSKSEEKLLLNLTDLSGKSLQTKVAYLVNESAQLNMADLPAGVYVLYIQKAMGAPVKAYKVLKN